MGGKSATKTQYFDKLKALLEEYHSIFIVGVDNVSSQQMHEIRQAMRNKGVILMGKNTMVCWNQARARARTIRTHSTNTPSPGSPCAQGFRL